MAASIRDEYRQRDHEYARVYDAAHTLQMLCEQAGMTRQARMAKSIKEHANLRLVALHVGR